MTLQEHLELQIEALLLECDSSNPYSTSKLLSTKFKLEKEMQIVTAELLKCQNIIAQQKESSNQRVLDIIKFT